LEDEVTMLMKSDASSPAAPAVAPSPDPAETKIAPLSKSGQPGRKLPLALGGAGLLLAGTAAGAIFFSQQRPPDRARRAESAKGEPAPPLAPTPPAGAGASRPRHLKTETAGHACAGVH